MRLCLCSAESPELSSAIPSKVAGEFLEDMTTQITQVSTLQTTLPGKDKGMDTRLAVGLGVAAIFVVAVIATSILAYVLCVSCQKHHKQ